MKNMLVKPEHQLNSELEKMEKHILTVQSSEMLFKNMVEIILQ